MVMAVVGLNWGDEGKGRMIDYFAGDVDCVVRYQGGNNAGHTVKNEYGKFAFHNIPSGICYKNVVNIIAAGSVINPQSFIEEVEELKSKGLDTSNIFVSDRAIVILPQHILRDELEEVRLVNKKYGSTKSGIAPVYGDKFLKKAIQVGELLDIEYLKEHLKDVLEHNDLIIEKIYGKDKTDFDKVFNWLKEYGEKMRPYIKDVAPIIFKMQKENKRIMVEAQLGALRDITHGIYPYTTSSSTLAGYACASVPIKPSELKDIVGITKAYSTCVGEGPFVTEDFSEWATEVRIKANEFGATTGRPRRIGHFDIIATKYGCELQGATQVTITCLDVLSGYDELKICVGYEVNGETIKDFPMIAKLNKAKPIYQCVGGWMEDISMVRNFEDLPKNAQEYVNTIERLLEVQVKYISVGPNREELIVR
ncbi:MAG TPA: adenylosuccinate synthase [Clostridiales bacterium]|nr:MAG: adenylosuccinate synthase [Clostridiales bacterium GWD2_32_19]HCC07750.1 adenylosuccinate synthase [Clostridiales bacterium]